MIEKVLDQVLSIDEAHSLTNDSLLKIGLARHLLSVHRSAAGMTNEHLSGFASSGQRVRLRSRNQLLDQTLKLLGAAKGGVNVPVTDHLPRQVRQKGPALVARKSKFASIYKMSHLEVVVLVVIEQIDRAIATLRGLKLKTVLLKFVADFYQGLLAEAANAR